MTGKGFFTTLIILVVLAFTARIAVSYQLWNFNGHHNQVVVPSALTDMWIYKEYSAQILKGEYSGEFDFQPFYYTVFLPAISLVSGGSIWGVIIAQALLGAFTVYLAALSSARLWGKSSALITAFLLAFSGILILFTPYHLIATLQAFWVVLLFYLTLNAMKSQKLSSWAIIGFISGTAILTRGNAWFFVPGLLLLSALPLFKKDKTPKPVEPEKEESGSEEEEDLESKPCCCGRWKKILAPVLLFVLMILPQIPYAVHNTQVLSKQNKKFTFSGPSTAGQKVLALGNTPEAPPGGRDAGAGPGPMEYPLTFDYWMRNKGEVSIFSRIMSWFADEPMAFVELQLRKLLLFWDAGEIPNNIAMEHNGKRSPLLAKVGFIPSGLIISLAIAGILISLPLVKRKKAKYILLLYFVVAYWLATAAFYNLARFRLPIIPLLAVFAGGFVHFLLLKLKTRNYAGLLKFALPSIIFGILISYYGYNIYRHGWEVQTMRLVRPDGVKVSMGDQDMLLDNGPQSFGSWMSLELTSGTTLEKDFAGTENKGYKNAKLTLPVIFQTPGSAIFRINGKDFSRTEKKPGQHELSFELPFPKDGKFVITLVTANSQILAVADAQRDYGRTKANGKALKAELVCKVFASAE